jgi:hypothetical protein
MYNGSFAFRRACRDHTGALSEDLCIPEPVHHWWDMHSRHQNLQLLYETHNLASRLWPQTIEAIILQNIDRGLHKRLSKSGGHDHGMERRSVCQSTNGKKHLEMTMLLLEKIDRLEISVEVIAFFVPRVAGVVDIVV